MSEQVNTQAIVEQYSETTGKIVTRRLAGELVIGIRVDELPASEAERLAAQGKFYPLTTDKDGQLRVVLSGTTKVAMEELEVLREIRDLLIENRDLLLKIA